MRVLITGGAGFLGSHLCDRFLAEGHTVIAMDNLITGATDNIAHLAGNERFSFIKHDVTNYIFIDGPLDAVLHFASPASPVDYLELPIQTLKVGALGTHKALGLAKEKGARFLIASTSEVYGDPQIHPQPESYYGYVNPVGPRGVYDEAKRFAEAMTMAYHTYHGVETRIVRIFNSIMADETIVLCDEQGVFVGTAEEYAARIEGRAIIAPLRTYVPAFDPHTQQVDLHLASAYIKHPSMGKDAFRITTRYGRQVRVTGDHSVFRRGSDGMPEAVPVRELREEDYVAIPARFPVVERDRERVNLAEHLLTACQESDDLWEYALISPELRAVVEEQRDQILDFLASSTRFPGSANLRNSIGTSWRKYRDRGLLPLPVAAMLWRQGVLTWPADAQIRPYKGGGGAALRNEIAVTDDLLWLLGLYLAEGCHVAKGGDYRVIFSSDTAALQRAQQILRDSFGVTPVQRPADATRSPSLYVDSLLLYHVFADVFQITGTAKTARVPGWVKQLPLARLKHFLEGYRDGDGTHKDYPAQRELAFNTVSEPLATDLTYLLLRFGIVASVGSYETTYKQRYGDRKFPFYRVTVCEVSNFDLLTWDHGVTQTLNAQRVGDLVWAKVRSIEPIEATAYVYDFSVPGCENFVAGNGVSCHNTYGPRMRLRDGRVVPNFIQQALRGEPLTAYGDGMQTRSFQYVDDLIEGIYRLLLSDEAEPVNIGNPVEFTIKEFAELVNALTGNAAGVIFKDSRTKDDPQVRQPDITKAKRVLGWEPTITLEEGLRRTIPWFREELVRRGELT
jgi:nucleoside-diphosphate-sugar epimerase/intein/homing endonuclease